MYNTDDFLKLCHIDGTLHALYKQYGLPDPRPTASGFWALVRIVNAQLISTAAAHTILQRIEQIIPDRTAQAWHSTDTQQIRTCGMSQSKIDTLNTIAHDIGNDDLNLQALAQQPPQIIHKTLTAYKGIGNWTANAYALQHHTDVFLYDDLGVRDGVKIILNLDTRPSSAFCKSHYETHWQPYGSCATYFVWHIKNVVEKENAPL